MIAVSPGPSWIGGSLLIGALLLFGLASVRRRRLAHARGWRVRRAGRDELTYEELRTGKQKKAKWEKLYISGELLTTRRPSFVISFDTPEKWRSYPEWARDLREQIIARIQEACPAPLFEHDFGK